MGMGAVGLRMTQQEVGEARQGGWAAVQRGLDWVRMEMSELCQSSDYG